MGKNVRGSRWISIAFVLMVCCFVRSAAAQGTRPARNLAAGRKVVFAPAPNYELTAKGDTDATDLTDGQFGSRPDNKLWFESAAIGYLYAGLAEVALDLGSEQNVGEVVIRFQGGAPSAGISLPVWVDVLASDDGERYFRVGSYSRFRSGDRAKFGIPEDDGTARIQPLHFTKLDVRARYIGIELYGAGLTVLDELVVNEGLKGRKHKPVTDGEPSSFTVKHPRVYFHKPYVMVTSGVVTPTPVGIIVPEGYADKRLTMLLDLPQGIEFAEGHLGNGPTFKQVSKTSAGSFSRYMFDCGIVAPDNKAWGRLYLRADSPLIGQSTLRYQVGWAGGESPIMELPVQTLAVPATTAPARLMTGMGWWSQLDARLWPDAAAAYRHLGFNTATVFGRYYKPTDAALMKYIDDCQQAGLQIGVLDSGFYGMLADAAGKSSEVFCQFVDGTYGTKLCPSYRGPLYQQELDRIARVCATTKARWLSEDIELWDYKGPSYAERCKRCQADFQASKLPDLKSWQHAKGLEIWNDLSQRARTAVKQAGVKDFELGGYDFRPGRIYQEFWPFDQAYPAHMQHSEVSTYTSLENHGIELLGNEVRGDRRLLPKSDVLPWVSPGDAGTFPGDAFKHALLECFANGARGHYFWSSRVWDGESLAAYAEAIRIAKPVEDIICDGQLVDDVTTTPPVRVSGMRSGNEMFLLVANYRSAKPTKVIVRIPGRRSVSAVDLETGAKVAGGTGTLTITIDKESARALHVTAK